MKTKHASQIAPKPFWKNAILLAITALALVPLPSSRGDAYCNDFATTYWINPGTGDWFDPLGVNWSNGVPSQVSPTYINNGGSACINTTGQTATACHLVLGDQSGNSGTLSVNNGTLDGSNDIVVGRYGTGKLAITNGGVVTNPCCAYIADLSGSTGSVSVDGQNQQGIKSQWTITGGVLYVAGSINGAGGVGLLTVTNNGIVTAGDKVYVWNSGTLTGNSTVSTTNGTTIDGGTLSPNWTLTINGDLELDGGSTTQCNVTPSNLGSIDAHVSGRATLNTNSKLIVNMTGNFTSGTTYTLLHADTALIGTFTNVSINYPCECFTPKIQYDYTHNNVNLVLNPAACCTQ